MTGAEVAAIVVAVLGSGGLGAVLQSWRDGRRGVSADEREARRDTIADRDALIDQLQEQVSSALDRIGVLERWQAEAAAQAERRALLIRAQGDHIDLLEDDIRGLGGQPRPRPTGV